VFKSLQARLTLSHVIIIVVCLVLVGLAALVVLRGYQKNLVYVRLRERAILVSQLAAASLRRGAQPQDTIEWLAEQMSQGAGPPVHLYLLSSQGHVIAGSDNKLNGQHFEELVVPSVPAPAWAMRGERNLANGERLLYVAELVRIPREDGQGALVHVLLLAEAFRPVRLVFGDLLLRLAWAGLLALALSVILAALLAYSIARPLDRIAQAAEEIAAGHYDQELNISSPTEVARLATSFNSMARQVETTLQSQQDLVANVSHDLKTPLTAIQGFSQALLDGTARDDAARTRAAEVIHEEASRMRRLVDDLLDLARLEAGQVTLAHQPVDMVTLLQACAARFAPQLDEADVTLEVEVPLTLPTVLGDTDRLGQVFGNLVDNALRHARGASVGGRVVLRAEAQAGLLICSVTDNGPGIPAEDLNRIFERFYQVDKSRARRKGGAGLGLAIVQEIVHAHGGRVRVESVEGLGTRFAVELPAHQAKSGS
jgi:two-component system OmpR family sensor kinase